MINEEIQTKIDGYTFYIKLTSFNYFPPISTNPYTADSDWDLQDHLEYCYDVVLAEDGRREVDGQELSELVKEYSEIIDKKVNEYLCKRIKEKTQ